MSYSRTKHIRPQLHCGVVFRPSKSRPTGNLEHEYPGLAQFTSASPQHGTGARWCVFPPTCLSHLIRRSQVGLSLPPGFENDRDISWHRHCAWNEGLGFMRCTNAHLHDGLMVPCRIACYSRDQ
jgi:hypothetical protein